MRAIEAALAEGFWASELHAGAAAALRAAARAVDADEGNGGKLSYSTSVLHKLLTDYGMVPKRPAPQSEAGVSTNTWVV